MHLLDVLLRHELKEQPSPFIISSDCFDVPDCHYSQEYGKETMQNRMLAFFSLSPFKLMTLSENKVLWSLLLSGFYPKFDYFKCHACGLCLTRVHEIGVDIAALHLFARPSCSFMSKHSAAVRQITELVGTLQRADKNN